MDDNTVIKVDHLTKIFQEQGGAKTLKQRFVSFGKIKKSHNDPRFAKGEFKVLDDINFEIKKGEFFGIVGRNGGGKSTLLKLLAGVYTPSSGAVGINGRLTPFIELGVGFNPELSGRDNVFLNGALLGFTRRQMEEIYDDIVSFAELEDFMDVKLKNYSSGMQVRLAFSVAIRAESDILLIDEVLAVGDSAFQKKCEQYFEDLKHKKKTVILVTHDMAAIKKFCTKGALITKGKVEFIGSPDQIASLYEQQNYVNKKAKTKEETKETDATVRNFNIKHMSIQGKDICKVNFDVIANRDAEIVAGINIIREDGVLIAGINSYSQLGPKKMKKGDVYSCSFSFGIDQLTKADYVIDSVVYETSEYSAVYYAAAVKEFTVKRNDPAKWGTFNINGEWDS